MEFITVREFSASPRKTFKSLIDTLNRAEAMRLLEEIQMQAVRAGLNSMTSEEIDTEVAAYRRTQAVI